jgi:hypothetical protein
VAIADLQDGDRKVGFDLLNKNIWKGTLNLKDPEILKAVNLYISQA